MNDWSFISDRDKAILEFQMRILDLAYQGDDPLKKINFVKIIIRNLEEFVAIRLPQGKYAEPLMHILEFIYFTLGKTIRELNTMYGVEIPNQNVYYSKKIPIRYIQYIYSGENERDIQKELLEVANTFDIESSYVLLSSIETSDINPLCQCNIKVPYEVLCIDECLEIYAGIYPSKSKDTPNERVGIENYRKLLSKSDLVLRNPYDPYELVTNFIDQMCEDPDVAVLFISLYRVAKESKILKSLINARRNGKHVFVFVEPLARGDELDNIRVIQMLKDEGVCVRSKYFSYKVHAKMFLAIDKSAKMYAHIGTGNYNEHTALQYTDTHLLTSNTSITGEIFHIFECMFKRNVYSPIHREALIHFAPTNFRSTITRMIKAEIRKGKLGRIWMKCNNFCDHNMINLLYEASSKGVDVRILVRTGCSIRSRKNLKVRSKVGQYLEHDRLYIFGDRCFISSADMLLRNISKRVEFLCEIQGHTIIQIFDSIWNSPLIHTLVDGRWKLT